MAIYLFCTHCKTGIKNLKARKCPKCGEEYGQSRRYRVVVTVKGKRESRVVKNLTLARQREATMDADLERGDMGIEEKKPAPTLAEVWNKYLLWAKEPGHKATWDDDLGNYRQHLEKRFGKKHLDAISAMDVNRLKLAMTKGETPDGKPYLSKRGKLFSPATIKHQLVLLQRLYKFAQGPDFKYAGPTPFDHKQIVMPHLDNAPPRFLTREQLAALCDTLETWPNETTVAFIKFALFTGVWRGTLFTLTWADLDFERGLVALRVSHRRKGTETVIKKVAPEAMEAIMTLPRTSK